MEQGLLKAVPKKYLEHVRHRLIPQGRYVCQANKLGCDVCIVCDLRILADKRPACTEPDKIIPSAE